MITTLSYSSRDPSFPDGDTLRGDDEDVGSVGAHAPPLHHLLPLLPHCHLIPVIRGAYFSTLSYFILYTVEPSQLTFSNS